MGQQGNPSSQEQSKNPMEQHPKEPKYRSNLYINTVTLMGLVPFAPTARISKSTGALWTTFDLSVHSVGGDGQYRSGESFVAMCKAWGHTARGLVDRVAAKSFVLVHGSIAPDQYSTKRIRLMEHQTDQPRKKSTRGIVCIHVDQARLIRKPVDARATINIRRDEYRRLKALEKHFDPHGGWLDPAILARYDLDSEEFDDLISEGAD